MTVLLPTPPLPLAMAMVRVCEPGPKSDLRRAGRAGARRAGERVALVARHGVELHLDGAAAGDRRERLLGVGADLVAQRAAGGGEHDGRADARRRRATTSRTMPRSTMSRWSSGSLTLERARSTSSWVTPASDGRIGLWCVPARRAAQSAAADRISRALLGRRRDGVHRPDRGASEVLHNMRVP